MSRRKLSYLARNTDTMFIFTSQDLDASDHIKESAIAREKARFPGYFCERLEASFVQEMYRASKLLPHYNTSNENLPEGAYIEIQIGRSVENKFAMRFPV
jgi:hypothetical protein